MEQVMERVVVRPTPLPPLQVVEASPWPEQGQWTYDDYLRLPDDGDRYEIIDGVLYRSRPPVFGHQYAVGQLSVALGSWLRAHPVGVALLAPFEIHLSETSRPVQPDVFFIAAGRGLEPGAPFFEGAPDLIVEVLSPSSIRMDRFTKFDAYERAGVGEYWIVNPDLRTVEVWHVDDEGLYALLGQFRADEAARSAVLEGFGVAVADLFAA